MLATNWQVFTTQWTTASTPPSSNDDVTIQVGHNIIITDIDGGNSDNAHAGSILIENGASLVLQDTDLELFLYNTAVGADLIVNGSYQDNGSTGNGTRFQGGATWRLGSNGNFIKTNNSSAAVYRDNYEGGMLAIPASASWIIRYVGSGDPNFTTIDSYYPNLRFENSAGGNWNPAIGSSHFQGSSGTATIYGNLTVGGAGGGTVNIYNQNTNGSPLFVQGDISIGFGSTLSNQGPATGTGFYCQGNISVEGTLIVAGNSTDLTIGGTGTQNLSGSGTFLVDNLTIANTNGLSLARNAEVNNLTLGIGKVMLNNFTLTVIGDISGVGPQKYIQTNGIGASAGKLIRPVSGSVLFPIGNDQYNPAILQHSGSGSFGVRIEDQVEDNGIQQTTDVVNRTWHIDGAISGSLNLSLQWDQAQELSGFNRNNCYIAHYNGSYWDAGPTGSASGGPPFSLTRSGITNLSPFVVASSGALPVELIQFRAEKTEAGVSILWATATEVQNAYFEIERSANSHAFEPLAQVSGAGTTNELQAYQFVDKNPKIGQLYYRLKQVDYDGAATYSEVKSIFWENKLNARIHTYPNPVNDFLFVEMFESEGRPMSLRLMDSRGQLVREFVYSRGSGFKQLDISKLLAGVYFLVVESGGIFESIRFVKR